MTIKINGSNLVSQRINSLVREFEKDTNGDIEEVLKKVSRRGALRLRDNSSGGFENRSPGALTYRRGWRAKSNPKVRNRTSWVVYNTKYQLTHLLEKGHKNRNKSLPDIKAFPHIAQEEERLIQEYIDELVKAIGGN